MLQLSPRQVVERLQRTDAKPILLDVREAWELDLCKITGCLHLPMASVPTALDRLPIDTEIIVCCHHGVRSLQIANFLVRNGYQSVANLRGGIEAWASDIDPEMRHY